MRTVSALFAALLCFALPLSAQPGPLSADQIMAQAKSQAASEHKNILAVFSASWCGPCHLFESFLKDPVAGPILDAHFVIARFDVGEHPGDKHHADTPGAVTLRSSVGGANPGYPYLVMLDSVGKPIVNSFCAAGCQPPGENIGYPATPGEIDWFMKMVQKAAPALSASDASALRAWLTRRSHI